MRIIGRSACTLRSVDCASCRFFLSLPRCHNRYPLNRKPQTDLGKGNWKPETKHGRNFEEIGGRRPPPPPKTKPARPPGRSQKPVAWIHGVSRRSRNSSILASYLC